MPAEHPAEVTDIRQADRVGDLRDAQPAGQQQRIGPLHPPRGDVLVRRQAGRRLEGAGEVERAQRRGGGEVVDGERVAQALLDDVGDAVQQYAVQPPGERPPRRRDARVVPDDVLGEPAGEDAGPGPCPGWISTSSSGRVSSLQNTRDRPFANTSPGRLSNRSQRPSDSVTTPWCSANVTPICCSPLTVTSPVGGCQQYTERSPGQRSSDRRAPSPRSMTPVSDVPESGPTSLQPDDGTSVAP